MKNRGSRNRERPNVGNNQVCIRVPATTANLGPGFDSFGLALKCYNRFFFQINPEPLAVDRLAFSSKTCVDVANTSLVPGESLVFQALERFYETIQLPRPTFEVEIEAHIPLARGLGSSSTVIVGALVGANTLAGHPLDVQALLRLATDLEGHPDNVAPALLGGALLCDMVEAEVQAYPLPWPEDWKVVVVVPEYRLLTEKARSVLPQQFPLGDAIFNLRKASLMTYALLRHDEQAFAASLSDRLHQPYRSGLIPEFEPLQDCALQAGAFGCVISGGGPSMAVFYPEANQPGVMAALQAYVETLTTDVRLLALSPDLQGAHVA